MAGTERGPAARSALGRAYVLAASLLVLFLGWAAVAAHPWDAPRADPRVAALAAQRAEVRREAAHARRVVAVRWARYEKRLATRRREIRRAWEARRRAEAAHRRLVAAAVASRSAVVVAAPGRAAAAPPVVSVGAAAPVTASRSS